MRVIPFGKPIIGDEERAAVAKVLNGTQLVHGPLADQFENDFAARTGGHATTVASCTAGLHLAYFDLGIGPGDEVIVPAQTHVATAHAVEFTGASCVFVDVEPATGNIDIDAVRAAVTERTKAITLVHYLGLPADLDPIVELAAENGLMVVEDCALAVGSYYKGRHCGTIGDIGCYSFYPVKHITTGEGGMVISRHEDLIERIRRKKAFGLDRTVNERKLPGYYDVTMLGFNYRMNEMAAALGIEQLMRLDEFLKVRARNYGCLHDLLSKISGIGLLDKGDDDRRHSHYCLSIVLNDDLAKKRTEIIKYLQSRDVGTSIYYPKAVPMFGYYYDKYGHAEGSFPNAERISNNSIALPVGPHLDTDDMAYIAESVKDSLSHV